MQGDSIVLVQDLLSNKFKKGNMKSVVITGSSRGLGFEMAKCFLENGYNVTLSGSNSKNIEQAVVLLKNYSQKIFVVLCDVKKTEDLQSLWTRSFEKWGRIDIWINNAGVNQPDKKLIDILPAELENVFRVNFLGTVYGTQIALQGMIKQGFGQVYNMEGFGSNGSVMVGLDAYGTTKRSISHVTKAFSNEVKGTNIQVGLLSPGMMVTDFIKNSEARKNKDRQTERIFNMLGNKPEVSARFLVKRMIPNKRNGARFRWLTGPKVMFRFVKWIFIKQDLFKDS